VPLGVPPPGEAKTVAVNFTVLVILRVPAELKSVVVVDEGLPIQAVVRLSTFTEPRPVAKS
jgi:hypothetical protein